MKRLILFLLVAISRLFATISSNAVWEVRSTGNDNNGGGYVTGSSGTDFSQQDTPQFALTSIVTAGTGATFLTSSAASTMVGNTLQVVSGTNFVTGFFQITSVSVGVSVTCDANVCTGVGASGVINIGGALATVTKALGPFVSSNQLWIKNGSYTHASDVDMTGINATPGNGTNYNRIYGYNTTRNDRPTGSNRPTLTATSSCTVVFNLGGGWDVQNVTIDCGTTVANTGISTSQYATVSNCKVSNFKLYGIKDVAGSASHFFYGNEVTGGTSAATYGISQAGGGWITANYVHDNACPGIYASNSNNGGEVVGNISANNTGASSDGIVLTYSTVAFGNSCYANGRDGIHTDGYLMTLVQNNILVNNAGYGLRLATDSSSLAAQTNFNYNAFYNNTTGARNGIPAGNNDVTLTGVPFTAAGSGDFSLNSTSGQGTACKGAGFPSIVGVTTTAAVTDLGAAQAAAGGGGGGSQKSSAASY